MDDQRAATLLSRERQRVEQALQDLVQEGGESRSSAIEGGDIADPAEPLTDEQVDDAVAEQLRERLAAIDRAEERLKAGHFGLSLKSGRPIPDARLEADPAAELTAEEAAEN